MRFLAVLDVPAHAGLALVCALAAASVLGCGGSSSAARDPSELRSFDIVSLLPHDAEAVVVIDVATLRRAPFMAHVTEALQPVLEGKIGRAHV